MDPSLVEDIWKKIVLEPTLARVRSVTENVTREELERIVKKYESGSKLHKLRRFIFYEGACFEENLIYLFARKISAGDFNWVNDYDWVQALKENERKNDQLRIKQEEEWFEAGKRIEIFYYSLQEFERMKQGKYKIVNNGQMDKRMMFGIYPNYSDRNKIIELGKLEVEALVNFRWAFSTFGDQTWGKGLPVKKIY